MSNSPNYIVERGGVFSCTWCVVYNIRDIYFKESKKVVKINKELSASTKATHFRVNILTKRKKNI